MLLAIQITIVHSISFIIILCFRSFKNIIFEEGSRRLMVANSLRCFDAMFTVLSDSVEPNSTFTGVMYRLFSYFTSAACATSRL